MRKLLADNWIVVVLGLALATSVIVAIRNHFVIQQNNLLQQQTELVEQRTREILSGIMHGLDLGVRGYGLTRDDNMLRPYREAIQISTVTFHQLDSLLKKQTYNDDGKLMAVRKEVDAYIVFSKQMVDTARIDSINIFKDMLKQDKGYEVWKQYSAFSQPLLAYEDQLNKEARANYNAAIRNNLILQITIAVLALPLLFIFIQRVRKERDARQALLLEVQENDRKYVFDPGESQALSASEINESSIQNVRKASDFIRHMTDGNYDVDWKGLDQSNADQNAETLAGNLVRMREQLKRVRLEDEKRNWINEGLATFSELVRNNQHDNNLLADRCISFLTKYLHAQQGSLFVVEESNGEKYLELKACFAFDKKKWVQKRIDIGQGLIGQAYLEGDTIELRQVPQGYTAITSGLGDATPSNLVIVPLKYDVTTVAILELASFEEFQEHHINFLKKAGEFLASAILNTQNTHKMKELLDHARINEEQMKQREEEMRQNMEELQATQEELVRKEREMQKRMEMTAGR